MNVLRVRARMVSAQIILVDMNAAVNVDIQAVTATQVGLKYSAQPIISSFYLPANRITIIILRIFLLTFRHRRV